MLTIVSNNELAYKPITILLPKTQLFTYSDKKFNGANTLAIGSY